MTNEELVAKLQKEYDPELMSKLWEQTKKYVMKLAKRYTPALRCPDDEEDLVQEGYFGILKAVERYNTESSVPFIVFSSYFLHSSFSDYIGRQAGGGRSISFRIRMLRKYETEYYELMGRAPTDEQICYALCLSHDGLELIRRQGSSSISIDASGDDDDLALLDSIPDPNVNVEEDVIDQIVRNQIHNLLVKYIDELPELQRKIIRMIYFGNRTEKEIAEALMINLKEVRNQKAIALRALRVYRHRSELGRFLPERLSSGAYRGSLSYFKSFGASSTEETAIRNINHEQKYTESRLYTQ